jgi:type I restriction enzyme S subunit
VSRLFVALAIAEAAGPLPFALRLIGVDRAKVAPGLSEAAELRYVPTIIVRRDGTEVGRIVETATRGIEQDLLDLLTGALYGSNGIIGGSDSYFYENAIVIGRVGAYCGSVAYAPGRFWSSDNTLVARPSSADIDVRFVFYLLKHADLGRHAGGAAQPLVTQTVLRQVEVRVPGPAEQRRIAGILSAYDDLIENCERRIRVLDEMARVLYREWFVLFRYPGHQGPLVDSPLGRIPKGWEISRLDSALTFENGRPISKQQRESGTTAVYGANGVIGTTSLPAMAERGVVMGKIGSCGALHRAHAPMWVTNNAFLVRPALIRSEELVWHTLRSIDFAPYIGGAANPYLPVTAFGQHEVLVPPEDVQTKTCRRGSRPTLRLRVG